MAKNRIRPTKMPPARASLIEVSLTTHRYASLGKLAAALALYQGDSEITLEAAIVARQIIKPNN